MTTIVAIVGDLHVNSSVALCPAEMKLEDGPVVKPSQSQEWLRQRWLEFWGDVMLAADVYHAPVLAVINGDWGDVNRHSQYQLIEPVNTDVILDWMVEVVEPVRKVAQRVFVTRGTEAHTGGVGWLENRAAKEIGAEPDPSTGQPSWWVLRMAVEGVNLLITHHPGTNSLRPWMRGGAANRAAAMVMDAFYGEDWQPDVAVFGHVHHNEDSLDNHPVRTIFNRSWTLKDALSYRVGFGIQQDVIGGLMVVCGGGRYRVVKRGYALPRGRVWESGTGSAE